MKKRPGWPKLKKDVNHQKQNKDKGKNEQTEIDRHKGRWKLKDECIGV